MTEHDGILLRLRDAIRAMRYENGYLRDQVPIPRNGGTVDKAMDGLDQIQGELDAFLAAVPDIPRGNFEINGDACGDAQILYKIVDTANLLHDATKPKEQG